MKNLLTLFSPQAGRRLRTWMILLFIVNLASLSLSNSVQAQSAEETAIKTVLKNTTEAYFKKNAEGWQSNWSHSANITRWRSSSVAWDATKGWDKLSAAVLETIKGSPEPVAANIVQDNFLFRVDSKLATVEYTETISNLPDEPAAKYTSQRFCTLQKENNQWKIVSLVSNDQSSYTEQDAAIEARINATGYSLLNAKKVDEAIELLALNVKLFPKAWNTYDSLGEAYALKGNKELAIKNYEKSMVLNPKNDNGKDALAKLKK